MAKKAIAASLALLFVPFCIADTTTVLERVLLTDAASERGAKCLDGSPGAYYVRKPTINDRQSKSWLIFHEGGGWCGDNQNCLDRSKGDLGSSKDYPPTLEKDSPLFQSLPTFTIIFARYCDGSSWTGDVSDPVYVNGTGSNETGTVYYRGRRLLDALFDDLLTNRGLAIADHVVYGGCSAGALTSYLHIDYIQTLLPNTTSLSGIADAMFSLHHRGFDGSQPNYYTNQMVWGYQAWNSSRSINERCRDYYSRDDNVNGAWMCLHGAIAARFVQTPMLIVNSKYDTWQEGGVLGIWGDDCKPYVAPNGTVSLCNNSTPIAQAKERFWRAYGTEMVRAVMETVPEWHGAFLTNCPAHCMTWPFEWSDPAGPDVRLGEAVAKWLDAVIERSATTIEGWKAPRWIPSEEDKCVRASPWRF